ncbi:MAG: 16S rRNA (guanine(966)-N(2))-methyltransferase RsmD [Gammaproteobacteria bacterium]
MKKNKLRIIGGEWRSRQLPFPSVPGLRPTPNRVRETLFNWLQCDVARSRCLDLFAGSGALGLEAASRGAEIVVQVEHNAAAARQLREHYRILDARQLRLEEQEVLDFLRSKAQIFDIVFMDPPFGQNLIQPVCRLLEQQGWLATQAKIYIEAEAAWTSVGIPENWRLLKAKIAGEVGYRLFQRCDK